MATQAQIDANRKNAQKSSGPTSDEGKDKVRQNALRHGLCASLPQMSDENDEDVQLLLAMLREEHQPVGATEEILVYKMAEHFFYGKRASYLLSEQLDWADKGAENARQIALMLRYHTTADRGYYKALNELRKVQKERRLQEIGSVSQNAQPPVEATPEASPEPPAKPAPAPPQPPVLPLNQPAQPPIAVYPSPRNAAKAA